MYSLDSVYIAKNPLAPTSSRLHSIASMPNLNDLETEKGFCVDWAHPLGKSPVSISGHWIPVNSDLFEVPVNGGDNIGTTGSIFSFDSKAETSPRSSFEAPARLLSPRSSISSRRQRSHSIDCSANVKAFCLLESNRREILESDLPSLVSRADGGLKSSVNPILAEGAMGGSYFLRDKNRSIVLVFKPSDEEPNAPNNPYQGGTYGSAYKGRIVPGFGMYRELAAFILDNDGFAGVPPTEIAKVRHPVFDKNIKEDAMGVSIPYGYKLGSVQSYVRSECSADEMGSSRFDQGDVQRIAVLDIRICNLDRHPGNILVAKSTPYHLQDCDVAISSPPLSPIVNRSVRFDFDCSTLDSVSSDCKPHVACSAPASTSEHWAAVDKLFEKYEDLTPSPSTSFRLIPIDHGYCLPHVLHLSDVHFTWLHWQQTKDEIIPEVRAYISKLDIEKDIMKIQQIVGAAIPESSLLTLRVCTILLQKGVDMGLNLYDIGMCMVPDQTPSNSLSPLQLAVNIAIYKTVQKELSRSFVQPSPYAKTRFVMHHGHDSTSFASASDIDSYASLSQSDLQARLCKLSKASAAVASPGHPQIDIADVEGFNTSGNNAPSPSSKQRHHVTDDMLQFAIMSSNGSTLNKELVNAIDELVRSRIK